MGTVAAVDANHIMVQTGEGKTLSMSVDANTKFRQGDKAAAATDLKVGDRIVAEVSHKGDSLTASEIRFAPPAQNKRASGQEEHQRVNETLLQLANYTTAHALPGAA
jgi:hypothetical protein